MKACIKKTLGEVIDAAICLSYRITDQLSMARISGRHLQTGRYTYKCASAIICTYFFNRSLTCVPADVSLIWSKYKQNVRKNSILKKHISFQLPCAFLHLYQCSIYSMHGNTSSSVPMIYSSFQVATLC